jgi:uracil-DNA glycosylase
MIEKQPVAPEAPATCTLCPRLVEYLKVIARDEPEWHNAPVDSFGDEQARLLVIGMAPGRGGANRTGRPFTGDGAGDYLYNALAKHGFSEGEFDKDGNDDLQLIDCMITNAVRCVPPQNKPTGEETRNCRPFLVSRLAHLPKVTALIALGRIAHDNILSTLELRRAAYPFGHGAEHVLTSNGRQYRLFDSYHCSRYNTNTRRLTETMFDDVFIAVRAYLDAK